MKTVVPKWTSQSEENQINKILDLFCYRKNEKNLFKTCSNSKIERLLFKKSQVKIIQQKDGEELDSVQKKKSHWNHTKKKI